MTRSTDRRGARFTSVGALAITGLLAGLVLSGCGSHASFHGPTPLNTAPEPAFSPPLTATPAGRLVPVGEGPEGIVASASGLLAVAVRGDHPGVDLFDPDDPSDLEFIPLAGEARHLALDGASGPLLVPEEPADQLAELALPSGQVERTIRVGRQPHDATALNGTIAVGNEFGNTVEFIAPDGRTTVAAAPLQPGGVAAEGSVFVVVGVRARVIAAYSPTGRLLSQADCGVGPTHVVAGPDGYFFVADTNGGRLIVYRFEGGSLREVNDITVGSRPYGLAADPATGWVYVTLTGSNQVLGLRFSGSTVVESRSWATGLQPNTVAVDTHFGLLAVTATDSDEVQLIPLPGS